MAAAKENVVIQAGDYIVTLMPEFGGKIASISVAGTELLQTPLHPYAPRTQNTPFDAGDASGWDECLPSVGACSVNTPFGPASVPDHGDLWRLPWEVLAASADSATLRVRCFSLPLELTRTVLLTPVPGGAKLQLLYSLTNTSDYTVPWSWSAHPLFTALPGDRVVLPASVQTLRLEGSGNNRLGLNGDSVSWPIAHEANGERDISLAQDASTGIGDKLFAGPLSEGDGWCILERPNVGLRITIRFESAITPYLGLWLCYGGWPGGDGLKQVCVAPEPCTAPVDSLAETGPWSRQLTPGETCTWPMEVEIVTIPAEA